MLETIYYLVDVLTPYGGLAYAAIFSILVLCGFGLPLPEDVPIVTSGILSAVGILDFYTSILVCLAGVMVGDGIVFSAGRRFGPIIREWRYVKRVLTEQRQRQISKMFERYGDKLLFVARFLPGLRTPIFLSAGIFRVKPWKFFAFDGSAALISVPAWVWAGHLFGENVELLDRKLRDLKVGTAALLGILVLVILIAWIVKKRMMKIAVSEEEAPPASPPKNA